MGEIVSGMFNDSYPPIIDGVAIVVKNYARWLNRTAGPSCVVTPDNPEYFDREEFPVYRYPSMPMTLRPPYRLGMNFLGEVKEKRVRGDGLKETLQTNLYSIPFDIVHSHCPFSSGILAYRIAQKRDIPLVTTFHTKYKEEFLQAIKSELLATLAVRELAEYYYRADLVWVPTEETIDTLRSYGYDGPVEVMPNAADLIVDPDDIPALRREGAERFGIPEGIPTLLFIGQHIKEKNLDLVLDSLALLKGRMDFRMLFIGDGYYAEELKRKAGRLGLGDEARFMGTIMEREEIMKAYARADLLFFPSLYDTSGLVIKEAAGLRRPSLLVRGSTIASDTRDGENGFLAENEPSAMAAKLEAILRDPELLKKTGEGAYADLFQTWESVVARVAERYAEILDGWKGR